MLLNNLQGKSVNIGNVTFLKQIKTVCGFYGIWEICFLMYVYETASINIKLLNSHVMTLSKPTPAPTSLLRWTFRPVWLLSYSSMCLSVFCIWIVHIVFLALYQMGQSAH